MFHICFFEINQAYPNKNKKQKKNTHTDYPFDIHDLSLQFSLGTSAQDAVFDEQNVSVRLLPDRVEQMAGVDWDVYDTSYSVKTDNAISSGSHSGKRYSQLVIKITIARKWKNVMHDVIFPLQLINIVPFAIYFMETSEMILRLMAIVSLMLTLFAFKWTVSRNLPPVPYLTLLDWLC